MEVDEVGREQHTGVYKEGQAGHMGEGVRGKAEGEVEKVTGEGNKGGV